MALVSTEDSFDYYGSDDSAFLEALRTTVLPGDIPKLTPQNNEHLDVQQDRNEIPTEFLNAEDPDISVEPPPCAQPSKRRRYSSTEPRSLPNIPAFLLESPELSPEPPAKRQKISEEAANSEYNVPSASIRLNDVDTIPESLPSMQPVIKRPRPSSEHEDRDGEMPKPAKAQYLALSHLDIAQLDEETYGAAHFSDFGEFVQRKRAKLQIQDKGMARNETSKQAIFKGLAIYVNGHTRPSVQDLRKLIVDHGGIFRPYLDKKSIVTHVITSSLTPAKVKEFQRMKLVRPEWITESVRVQRLIPWREFMYRPGGRVETKAQGKSAQATVRAFARPGHTWGRGEVDDHGYASQEDRGDWEDSFDAEVYNDLTPSFSPTPTSLHDPLSPREPISPIQRAPSPKSTALKSTVINPAPAPVRPIISAPARAQVPYTADAASPPPAAKVLDYAHGPNAHAARAMQDATWRAAHTAVAPDFIEGYYKNSRLHHLATWKTELRALVAEAQENAERAEVPAKGLNEEAGVSMRGAKLVLKSPLKRKAREQATRERVIMHVDFDAFFVSAGLVARPDLKGKPVVVCHSQGGTGGASSTSEIASASYEAREFGIRNGMSLRQARGLCPNVLTIPYEFELYKKLTLKFYTILMTLADDLQAVSVDEALIDVTSTVAQTESAENLNGPATVLAESIRAQVREATGCTVSIGIAQNIMLARLATRKAKPAGSYHLVAPDLPQMLPTLDIRDLHGFGWATAEKSREKLGTTALGDLVGKSRAVLCDALGRGAGETLWKAMRGIDERKLESDKPRRSVSCEINYGIRFESSEQAERFIFQMAEEVTRRLRAISMKGRALTLKVMKRDPSAPVEAPKFMGHGICLTYNKQSPLSGPLGRATDDDEVIGALAWKLLKSMNILPTELRGLGIQIQKLESSAAPAAPAGQIRLPFKPVSGGVGSKKTSVEPGKVVAMADPLEDIVPELDVQPAPGGTVPQVDMSVFNALPDDLRNELEAEYKRRSVTPAPNARALSLAPDPEPRADLARITKQLAPRSRPALGPAKGRVWFALPVKKAPALPRVTLSQLRTLGLDAEVFRALPVKFQREQLAQARGLKTRLSQRPARARRPIKAPTRLGWRFRPPQGPHEFIPPPPPPKAVFVEKPTLKRPAETEGGPKKIVVNGAEVQRMIKEWVEGFHEHVPHRRDVEYFGKYLEKCVESDTGIERAMGIVRWWSVLLRRLFGVWERAKGDTEAEEMLQEWAESGRTFTEDEITSEIVGRAWWKVFKEITGRMSTVARKRFGGSLALR